MNIQNELKKKKAQEGEGAYWQYRSDCWRNTAYLLYEAIQSGNPQEMREAKEQYSVVKKMFPFKII